MATNEEKRLAIIAELGRRAAAQGSSEAKYYQRLTPALAILMQEAGTDAVELTGLVRTLTFYAAMVGYGAVGTPGDTQFRTGEDMAKLAESMWQQACEYGEMFVSKLQSAGVEIPEELQKKIALAPSDQSKRPDIPVKEPTVKPERGHNLAEIMTMFNSPGSRGN